MFLVIIIIVIKRPFKTISRREIRSSFLSHFDLLQEKKGSKVGNFPPIIIVSVWFDPCYISSQKNKV